MSVLEKIKGEVLEASADGSLTSFFDGSQVALLSKDMNKAYEVAARLDRVLNHDSWSYDVCVYSMKGLSLEEFLEASRFSIFKPENRVS